MCCDEPFKKLVNQGMIQGRSNFVYRVLDPERPNTYVSYGLKDQYRTQEIHVDVNIVKNDVLDQEAFKAWRPEFADAEFITESDGRYICGWAIEKMSKSMFNVVNPDMIVENYGADTLRMYEMFLGPLEQSKPWDTNGIDGVHKFLKRLWRLVENVDEAVPTPEELKTLHKTIKKVGEDIENFSFNTSVSAFMICLNELYDHKTTSRQILEPLVALVAPFAPHIAEELWHGPLGHPTDESVCDAPYPMYEEKYVTESSFEYPVSFNGKMRFKRTFDLATTPDAIAEAIKGDEQTAKYTDGRPIRKVIVVPGKIINVVC